MGYVSTLSNNMLYSVATIWTESQFWYNLKISFLNKWAQQDIYYPPSVLERFFGTVSIRNGIFLFLLFLTPNLRGFFWCVRNSNKFFSSDWPGCLSGDLAIGAVLSIWSPWAYFWSPSPIRLLVIDDWIFPGRLNQ